MVETHAITREQADKAKATPLKLAPPNVEASDAPYFVDMVRDTIVSKLNEREVNEQGYRIYTTLDPELQRAAAQAVETGIKLVDDQVTKMRTKRTKVGKNKFETTVAPGPQAQVALVAMDPHTGEIKALVGGRNYGVSQLNHALAKRPTGSIFKPFVYAAAMNTAIDGSSHRDHSGLDGYRSAFHVLLWRPDLRAAQLQRGVPRGRHAALRAGAFAQQCDRKVAEEVGYDKVADLAKAAGITSVKATPAMALGAYDATPVDMTAAYTTFANGGVRLSPVFVNSVRNAKGDVIVNFETERKAGSRSAGCLRHDQHAGRRDELRHGLRGARARIHCSGGGQDRELRTMAGSPATPATCCASCGWDTTTTATSAVERRADRGAHLGRVHEEGGDAAASIPMSSRFAQPEGVVDVQLDKVTNRLATPTCPDDYTIAFVAGTEPHDTCDQTSGVQGFFSRIFWRQFGKGAAPPTTNGPQREHPGGQPVSKPEEEGKKKKSFFGKIAGVFKGDSGKALCKE